MRSWISVAVLAGVLALAAGIGVERAAAAEQGAHAQAADQPATYVCPMHPDIRATWEAKCPKCGMMTTKADKGMSMPMMAKGDKPKEGSSDDMATMMATMKDMKGMMLRCKMMMGAKIQKKDPAGVLALKDELDLTDAQVMRLEAIAATARREAEVVLTDEQKQKLEAMGGQPESMAEMHQRMQAMMMKMKEKKEEGR